MDWSRLELRLAARLAERSAQTYYLWVRQWYFGGHLATPDAFAVFLLSETRRGVSDSTRNKYISALRQYLDFTNQKNSPQWQGTEFKYHAEMNKRPDTFSDDEIVSLLSVAKQAYQCYFAMLAYTGARPTEIRHLNASDINLSAWYVTVAGTKTKEYRTIPLVEAVRPYITNHLKTLSAKLFNFSDTAARMELARMCRQLTIPYRPPYAFRHSLITRLINSDVPLFNVMAIAGHKKAQTTEHYYRHNTDTLRKALERDTLGYSTMTPNQKILLWKKLLTEAIERTHADSDHDLDVHLDQKTNQISFTVKVKKEKTKSK